MIYKIKPIDIILNKAIEGIDLLPEEGIILLTQTEKTSVNTIRKTADKLRQQQVGDTVTYVINCNINFTNICEQHCNFCAFRRDTGQTGAFWLRTDQILAKAAYAVQKQATEICIQGGLHPQAKLNQTSLDYYLKLVKTLKREFPQLHLHAFSPQEVQFIAREDDISYSDVIIALRDAGLGSMPGTAAEVLDDDVRRVICPEKINTQTWLEIVSTAHRLGVPTTSTILCGHIETPQQQIQHLIHLRNLQKTAIEKGYPARITEFVLLPFVGKEAPQPLRKRVGRDQPILENNLLLTAVARIMLGNWISNHQPSWVKLGLNGALKALQWGCNDIGGTLMEENITTMAGAKGGTCMEVETLQKAIQSIHRPYQQRDTIYSASLSIPDSK
ncbi:MAG: 7,8-didemethyl-8-hydroxy-5-deazariboflavin synthase subunit CofH [cyanobacterium endosymbiont of Rhopalodia musculus]|uniref:7,8-didemethyl-8-hydroxy-5-deazariboflavin synthase subunit CofH n=1 Tax=cyanobacterium endosymbiont of Epithemia clementina EcSB TaxID=3034674 RepID=UPI002480FEF1|nr:7,8-didemethyl-8-hydroxy-5-deazariboflavin synthase subunit CofH [cyanobacterium endosymbiont of Epithemia clementina EcSB]WGT66810.1 7,8-didemethyl-8-hydroxy-5-deazariboflavin synthase subunit CofH [cyanobacterium endosymbiont of Epithemia clementina EcSB]